MFRTGTIVIRNALDQFISELYLVYRGEIVSIGYGHTTGFTVLEMTIIKIIAPTKTPR